MFLGYLFCKTLVWTATDNMNQFVGLSDCTFVMTLLFVYLVVDPRPPIDSIVRLMRIMGKIVKTAISLKYAQL